MWSNTIEITHALLLHLGNCCPIIVYFKCLNAGIGGVTGVGDTKSVEGSSDDSNLSQTYFQREHLWLSLPVSGATAVIV